MQAREPEGAGSVSGQVLVGPREHDADRGARITSGVEPLQPLRLVGQLANQIRKRSRGVIACGRGAMTPHMLGRLGMWNVEEQGRA